MGHFYFGVDIFDPSALLGHFIRAVNSPSLDKQNDAYAHTKREAGRAYRGQRDAGDVRFHQSRIRKVLHEEATALTDTPDVRPSPEQHPRSECPPNDAVCHASYLGLRIEENAAQSSNETGRQCCDFKGTAYQSVQPGDWSVDCW